MAGGAGGYGNDDDSGRMIVDINVTPLVDITLVLLIIFMVTASLHRQPGDQGRPAQGRFRHRADQDHPRPDARTRTAAVPQRPGQQRRSGGRATSASSCPRTRSCRRSSRPTRPCPTATSSTSSISSSAPASTSSRSAQTGNRPAGSDVSAPGEGLPDLWTPTAAARAPPAGAPSIAVVLHGLLALGVVKIDPGAVPRRGADRDLHVEEKLPPPEVKPPPPPRRSRRPPSARASSIAFRTARRRRRPRRRPARSRPRPTSRRQTSACR